MKTYIISDGLNKETIDRSAIRVLVTNQNNEILSIYFESWNYTSFPGGGVEDGEDLHQAALREILEETGYPIKIEKELGVIVEKRKEHNFVQANYCYWGVVDGEYIGTKLTKDEIERGLKTKWYTLTKLKEQISSENNRDYRQNFFKERDMKLISLFERNNI